MTAPNRKTAPNSDTAAVLATADELISGLGTTEVLVLMIVMAVLAFICWNVLTSFVHSGSKPTSAVPAPSAAPAPVHVVAAHTSSVPVSMILLIAGLVAAAAVIGGSLFVTAVVVRGRRRTAATEREVQLRAAQGRRRSWDAALRKLNTVSDAYADAMLNPEYFLRFPLINDIRIPTVRALEDAHETVLAYHTDSYVDDAHWITTFSAAVDGFSTAWAAADTAARTAGLSPIPIEFHGNVTTAVKLMTHALDPAASDQERTAFRDKALALLGNTVTPRKQTLAAIAAPTVRALAAA